MMNFKKYLPILVVPIVFIGIFSVTNNVFAACNLQSTVQLNKQSATVPIPYPEGETLTATVRPAQGSTCDGFRVEFRVCLATGVLTSRNCSDSAGAVVIGNPTIQNGAASANWTVAKINNSERYWIKAVVGTGVGTGTSEVFSPGIEVTSGSSCSISEFKATTNGNNNFNFLIRTNSFCEGKIAPIELYCIGPTGNKYNCTPANDNSFPVCQITSNQCTKSWSGTPATSQFYFRACVVGGGCLNSYVDARIPGGACGDGTCNISESSASCQADCIGGGCGTAGQPDCRPGETQVVSFEIPNPLGEGVTDFATLVRVIAQWIFNLAIPIAVAMIVYAGILFLTSAGDTSKVTKARQVLMYAVIGLAIILIGSGFITLIQSILQLGGNAPPTP